MVKSESAAVTRCPWAGEDPLSVAYHDREWGCPRHGDEVHFEFLVLESAQAGLSWITILRKRDAYRRAYAGFDPAAVAGFGEGKIEELMGNASIVRNRKKIEASVNNARRFLQVREAFGSFDGYLWSFVDGEPVGNAWTRDADVPSHTALSDEISADLKSRGFTFIGSTIIYSHLQAVGVVNDHLVSCFRYREITGRYGGL
jgi:DNA-3-methyladenine glycosylase I